MKNIRYYLNTFLLLSGLALMSGCEWLGKKMGGCQTCEHPGSADSRTGVDRSQVLVKIDGKSAITVSDFEDYWAEILKLEPQAEALMSIMPNIRPETFKTYLNERLIQEWLKKEKRDQDPEYRKKVDTLRKQVERAIAAQVFQEYILNKIDKSDAAVEKFYSENKDKVNLFQQPPFTRTIGGVKAMGVEFNDEKTAREFYSKAQKPNANFTAIAKEFKKTVNNFGNAPVNMQSRGVDQAVKARLADIKSLPSVELIQTDRGRNFWIVKALAKTTADYLPFADVKEAAKQVMLQTKFPQIVGEELENLKKGYNVDETAVKTFFEEERKKKELELQDKLKEVQKKNETSEKPVSAS